VVPDDNEVAIRLLSKLAFESVVPAALAPWVEAQERGPGLKLLVLRKAL
jgi:hypothetical protein